jgi:phosphoglycerol transferase MdoB-like AlkP superfamily enzyme
MNTTPQPAGQQRTKPPLSEAEKASLAKTHTLFRIFVVSVLGAFFVYQLDVSYLWLTALLTVASLALGVMLLIRAARLKESRLVLIGTISGLVVSAIMVLLILVTALFFDEVYEYQACVGRALTDQAQSACRVQLQGSLPTQLP